VARNLAQLRETSPFLPAIARRIRRSERLPGIPSTEYFAQGVCQDSRVGIQEEQVVRDRARRALITSGAEAPIYIIAHNHERKYRTCKIVHRIIGRSVIHHHDTPKPITFLPRFRKRCHARLELPCGVPVNNDDVHNNTPTTH